MPRPIRHLVLVGLFGSLIFLNVWQPVAWAEEPQPPLHQRIDAVIDAARVGPEPPLSSDAEFLRRVSLDLWGVVPAADQVRAFLDDASSDKRQALVDRLLDDPRFARQMQLVFDVMLMERRPAKNIPQADWSEYLYDAFVQNRPLDEFFYELLAADGTEEKSRPAARFYLDREGEKHLLTRDVGRIFLGRDMQCAQCHDHPVIGDYYQSEYYGLFAFFDRSLLFTDKEKRVFFAEKAEGDRVDYASVFVSGDKQQTGPRLPGQPVLDEPQFEEGEQYEVKPAKDVRPVPKYSRRERLAEELTGGNYRPFARNLANRLWGHMLGRGVVHPYDLHHEDNPPSHPELLELLTDELVAGQFDLSQFLRQIALSRAYQRSSRMTPWTADELAEAREQLEAQEAERERLAAERQAARDELQQLAQQAKSAAQTVEAAAAEKQQAEMAVEEAEQGAEESVEKLAAARQQAAEQGQNAQVVAELADQARQVADKLDGDELLEAVAAQTTQHAEQLALAATQADQQVEQLGAEAKSADQRLTAAQQALRQAADSEAEARQARQALADERVRAEQRRDAVQSDLLARSAVKQDGKVVAELQQAVESPSEEGQEGQQGQQGQEGQQDEGQQDEGQNEAMELAWQQLMERWTERAWLTGLRPLSPEQMARSIMQVTGVLDRHWQAEEKAAREELEGGTEGETEDDTEDDTEGETGEAAGEQAPVDERELARRVESQVFAKTQGQIAAFVGTLSQGSGPAAADYQATVQEALFFANGNQLAGWLRPQSGNLTDRLLKQDDPAAVAEELYLSVLTRRPNAEESAAVAEHLSGRQEDRQAALEEMIWGLLASAEFRFNH